MGGTLNDLRNALSQIIVAFNAHDVQAVELLLDSDANVFSIHSDRQHQGRDASVSFLTAQFLDHPNFALRDAIDKVHIDSNGADGQITRATLTGLADWKDDHGPEVLNFRFECVYKDRWLFQRVAASTVR